MLNTEFSLKKKKVELKIFKEYVNAAFFCNAIKSASYKPARHDFLMCYACQAIFSSLKLHVWTKITGMTLNLQQRQIPFEQLFKVSLFLQFKLIFLLLLHMESVCGPLAQAVITNL